MAKKNGSSGQALVEFALILVVLLLFIFIIVEAGRLFQGWLTVQNAARAGGRYAITGSYEVDCLSEVPPCINARVDSIYEVAEDAVSGLNIDENAAYNEPLYYRTIVYGDKRIIDPDTGQATIQKSVPEYPGDSGLQVVVEVTYRMPLITPLLNSIVESIPLVGQVTLNNENWDQSNTNQSNNTAPDPPDLPPGQPSADLVITKSDSPDPVLVGQPLAYSVLIQNFGPFPAPNVVFTDTLPAGVSFANAPGTCSVVSNIVRCDVGYLDIGQSTTYVINTFAPSSGGAITNTVIVDSDEFDLLPESNVFSERTTVVDSADFADVEVVSKVDSKDPLVYDEAFSYTILVRNNGPAEATNVVINDTLPGGAELGVSFVSLSSSVPNICGHDGSPIGGAVICNIPTMALNEVVTIVINVIGPGNVGTFFNTASITADETDPVPANNNKTQDTSVLEPLVDLVITKSDSPDPVSVGQNLVYGLFISNNGPAAASGVVVQDTLPAGVTFSTAVASQGTCAHASGVVTCNLGNLAYQGNANVAITVVPTAAGTLNNSATVDAAETDTDTTNNTDNEVTTVQGSADLSITKTGPSGIQYTGENMTYNLTASNAGPSVATGVVVIDTLPNNVSYVSATASQGSCSHSGSAGGGIVTCNLGNILSGGSATVTIIVVPTAIGNPTTNTASVSSSLYDPVGTNNTASVNTNVQLGDEFFITLSPVCGDSGVTVTVNGYNSPDSPNNKPVDIYWDSTIIATIPSTNLPSWTKTFVVPANSTFAYHTVYAQRHNAPTATVQFKVPCPKPDLVISAPVLVSPPPIAATTPVSFRFTVTNQGDAPANSTFFVGLYFDPVPAPVIGTDTTINSTYLVQMVGLNQLAVGASRVVTLTAPNGFSTTGTHTVYGMVDNFGNPPYRVINELSERNNISTPLQVTVTAAPTATPTLTPSPGPSPTPSPTATEGSTPAPGILVGQTFVTTVGGQTLPQSGVFIYLYDSLNNPVNLLPKQSDTNALYSFTGLQPGSYTVTGCTNLDGVDYFYSSGVTITAGQVTTRDLFLTIGDCFEP
jgi:uncharacterized repeat protein (TIGR01451 family)